MPRAKKVVKVNVTKRQITSAVRKVKNKGLISLVEKIEKQLSKLKEKLA